MTIISYQGGHTIRLSKPTGNLKSHIKWLEYLTGDRYYPEVKKKYESKKNLREADSGAKAIILDEIYIPEFPNQQYKRTFSLLRSFIAITTDASLANVNIISDFTPRGTPNSWNPTGSPLATSGQSQGRFSYAAFFENPTEFKTFIPADRSPSRPFMEQLTDFMNTFGLIIAMESIMAATKKNMPRQLSE